MKKPLIAVVYYLFAITTIMYCVKNYKSDLGGPNLDILSIIVFIPISGILLLLSIYKSIWVNKRNFVSTVVHLIGCVALFLIISKK